MTERAAPVTTLVRITRTQNLEVIEYVDVQLCRHPDDAADTPDNDVALDLVKAKDAAGEDVAWFTVSERPAKYTHAKYFAEPAPINPATEG